MAPSSKTLAVISNLDSQNKPPLIGAGDISPELCYQAEKAFKGWFANKGIKPEDQVARALFSFQDHRIEEWIDVHNDVLIAGTFAEFMAKLRVLMLAPNWEAKLKTSILGMRQGDVSFIEFYNHMASRNILLRGSPSHLAIEKIRDQLEANMTAELREMVEYEDVHLEKDFDTWCSRVRRIDEHMQSKREQDRARYAKRPALSDSSRNTNTVPSASNTTSQTTSQTTRTTSKTEERPLKMTDNERELLGANAGCYKCRRPFVNHRSGECENGYPTRRFVVDQKYIDSFKSKPKAVAAVTRGREPSRTRLSGDHRDRRSASPRITNSRPTSRSHRSPTRRASDRFQEAIASRPKRSPVLAARSSSFDHIDGTDDPDRLRSSPSPTGPHPVAAVLGSSSNAVAYMPSNESNVLSSDSEDNNEVSFGDGDDKSVSRVLIAAVLPTVPLPTLERELKAPFHVEHLFWRCAVRSGSTDDVLVPVYDALIDDGAYAVLIRSSLVDELGLKRRKLPKPEEVEGAMSTPGDASQTTTLSEFVNLRLYCPVSGWSARTVRAIIAPSLCAPIILGLPFIAFNDIVIDAGLRTARCKIDSHDLLNPTTRVTKVIKGTPPTESMVRKAARLEKRLEDGKKRVLDRIWDNKTECAIPSKHEFFWSCNTIRAKDGSESRIRALLDPDNRANIIALETADHLSLTQVPLDTPIPYKCSLRGVDTTLSITSSVTMYLSAPGFEYTSKRFVALVLPEVGILSAQLILGAPFIQDNKIVIDDSRGTATVSECGTEIISAAKIRVGAPATQKKLPKLRGKVVTPKSTLAVVRERIEVLGAQQELIDRGNKVKADFPRLFDELPHGEDLPKDVYCRIKLKSAEQTIKTRSYSSPRKYRDAWRTLIDQHLSSGRIRPSSSQHVSPAFLIPKADPAALPRWVNDYRILNTNTIMDSYPLPRVDEILADCGRGKVFSIMDMTNSFFQTLVHPDDVHLTAVSTPFGLFEWLVMPMGLRNAPSIHQRRVAHALRGLLGQFCHIYIDDIIVWSDNIDEHEEHLRLIMEALTVARLYLNPKKCKLFQLEVDFLGHHISGRGIEANSSKVDRILNWPVPKSATDVRAFLGLVRYIASYLPQLAEHTRILTPLTRKEFKTQFPTWNDEMNVAFESIKKLVVSRECLTVIDHDDTTGNKIFVTTDASDWRTGAVLSFGLTWETARPVAFDSMQLKGAELNYPVHEKELLGIIRALKKWRMDLMGCEFTVYTDHRTLENFNAQRDLSRRQLRWQEFLSQYECTISYIKGEDNTVADALSRLPANTFADERAYDPHTLWSSSGVNAVLRVATDSAVLEEIIAGYKTDSFCQKLGDAGMKNVHLINQLWYVGDRLIIPRVGNLRENLFRLAHDDMGHFGADKSYATLRDTYYWPNMRRDLEDSYVPGCEECQRNKSRTARKAGPLHPLPVPERRGSSVGIDFIGPLPADNGHDCIVTMTCRAGSDVRIIPCSIKMTADELAVLFFNEWYCENGLPDEIVSDRDKLFVSKFWKSLTKIAGVSMKMTTSFHPEGDGISERSNKTVNQSIRYHVRRNQKGWVRALPRIRFDIMNSVNASTGYSGFQLRMGRSPRVMPPIVPRTDRLPVDVDTVLAESIVSRLLVDECEAKDNLLQAKVQQAFYSNFYRGPEMVYKVGDKVMLSTMNRRTMFKKKNEKRAAKFFPRWDGPYKVINTHPEASTYQLELPNQPNVFDVFHAGELKPHHANDAELFPWREHAEPGPVLTEDGLEEHVIDEIIDSKRHGRGWRFLIKWVGYGSEHDRWLSYTEIKDCEALDRWLASGGDGPVEVEPLAVALVKHVAVVKNTRLCDKIFRAWAGVSVPLT